MPLILTWVPAGKSVKGFSKKVVTIRKNNITTASTRFTTGMRERFQRRWRRLTSRTYPPSTASQNSREPSMPAHSPANLYMAGVAALL